MDAIVDYVAARQAQAMGDVARTKPETALPLPCTQLLVRGTRVTVRPMRAEDMKLGADFVRHLSAEARYNRFMVTVRELPHEKLNYLTHVDQQCHVALVACNSAGKPCCRMPSASRRAWTCRRKHNCGT